MKTSRLVVAVLFALGFGLVLSWYLSMGSHIVRAASIGVDTTSDGVVNDGNCTLREAIIAANTDTAVDACPAGNGADSITLTVAGTYVLTATGTDEDAALTGDLDITDALTIIGLGADQTIIDASGVISDRVIDILPGVPTVVISGATLTGGNVHRFGGGIYNRGQISTSPT